MYIPSFESMRRRLGSIGSKRLRQATVKLLVDNGADVHQRFSGQPSPMNIAVHMADSVSCIELLRKGALIDQSSAQELIKNRRSDLARKIWEGVDKVGLRPKDRAILLDSMLLSKHNTKYRSLKNLIKKTEEMLRPFLTAATFGELAVVEQVYQDHEFDINAASHQDHRSALHLAASNDHADVVKFLIEHGADCTLADSQRGTPLMSSVEKPSGCRSLEYLLNREADIFRADKDGLTAWHSAALAGNMSALSILVDFTTNGLHQRELKANDGRTLLHCAAQSSSKDTLIFLMGQYSQSAIHDTTSLGFTVLHYAVKAKSIDAVRHLIDHESDVHKKTHDGSNALHCAVDRDSVAMYEIIELLLKIGVDPCEIRRDGMTPIHLLLSRYSSTSYDLDPTTELEPILRVLSQYAKSIDVAYGTGLSALHQVCLLHGRDFEWRISPLQILLQKGADPTLEDSTGRTALMYDVETCKKEIRSKGHLSPGLITMVKVILDSTTNMHFLSTVCADPQILSLAVIYGDEELAYKALEHHPSVDTTVDEICG